MWGSWYPEAREMVKDYSEGKRITVFYNTRDPSSSYLEYVGFQPVKMLIAIFVIVLFAGGGGTVFLKTMGWW